MVCLKNHLSLRWITQKSAVWRDSEHYFCQHTIIINFYLCNIWYKESHRAIHHILLYWVLVCLFIKDIKQWLYWFFLLLSLFFSAFWASSWNILLIICVVQFLIFTFGPSFIIIHCCHIWVSAFISLLISHFRWFSSITQSKAPFSFIVLKSWCLLLLDLFKCVFLALLLRGTLALKYFLLQLVSLILIIIFLQLSLR